VSQLPGGKGVHLTQWPTRCGAPRDHVRGIRAASFQPPRRCPRPPLRSAHQRRCAAIWPAEMRYRRRCQS
jgi:hypothetical protein